MNRESMETLQKYRKHLLNLEQIALQERIAEERKQTTRLEGLSTRLMQIQTAKSNASTVHELCQMDQASMYLQGRKVMAQRALSVANMAHQEALQKTLQVKISGDQVGIILQNDQLAMMKEYGCQEQKQIDDLVTAKFATCNLGSFL